MPRFARNFFIGRQIWSFPPVNDEGFNDFYLFWLITVWWLMHIAVRKNEQNPEVGYHRSQTWQNNDRNKFIWSWNLCFRFYPHQWAKMRHRIASTGSGFFEHTEVKNSYFYWQWEWQYRRLISKVCSSINNYLVLLWRITPTTGPVFPEYSNPR